MSAFFRFAVPFRKLPCLCLLFFLAGLLASGCKSKPVPVSEKPAPQIASSLDFSGIEADSPDIFRLSFLLRIDNPFPSSGQAVLKSWEAEINGQTACRVTYLQKESNSGFNLIVPDSGKFTLNAASGHDDNMIPSSAVFPLVLDMDVEALAAIGLAPADEYIIQLSLNLEASIGTGNPQKIIARGIAQFPGVQAPSFSITSIAILKAELINTRFRVGLKIDNPNPYPVELSAFGYELYGNGRLWADGIEKNIIRVNKKSSLEGNLFLIMNFINMKRDLLDQIINLEDVNYRFTGEALVITGVDYLPKFQTSFDLSGYSQVFDN